MRNINQTLCYDWLERVWNNGEREAIDQLLTEDVIIHGLSPEKPLIGKEEFKNYYDGMRKELKDIHVEVKDVISQDNMESVLCTVDATDRATGKKVGFKGQCLIRVKDGRIAEGWNNFDFFNMKLQLGYKLTLA